jgi:hypothetical protein
MIAQVLISLLISCLMIGNKSQALITIPRLLLRRNELATIIAQLTYMVQVHKSTNPVAKAAAADSEMSTEAASSC